MPTPGSYHNVPDIYQEMVWTRHPENSSHPSKCSYGYWDNNRPFWDPTYMICMKTELPKTRSVKFMVEQPGAEPTWNRPYFELEDPWTGADSYISACFGDSGSGQFTTNQDTRLRKDFHDYKTSATESIRMIITAIVTTGSSDDGIVDEKGVDITPNGVPCGTNLYNATHNTYFQSLGVSEDVSSPKIHLWITNKYKNL